MSPEILALVAASELGLLVGAAAGAARHHGAWGWRAGTGVISVGAVPLLWTVVTPASAVIATYLAAWVVMYAIGSGGLRRRRAPAALEQ